MATYSLVIRRLMICSVTIVVSRAMTSPLLALWLSTRLGLNQQDIGLLCQRGQRQLCAPQLRCRCGQGRLRCQFPAAHQIAPRRSVIYC